MNLAMMMCVCVELQRSKQAGKKKVMMMCIFDKFKKMSLAM